MIFVYFSRQMWQHFFTTTCLPGRVEGNRSFATSSCCFCCCCCWLLFCRIYYFFQHTIDVFFFSSSPFFPPPFGCGSIIFYFPSLPFLIKLSPPTELAAYDVGCLTDWLAYVRIWTDRRIHYVRLTHLQTYRPVHKHTDGRTGLSFFPTLSLIQLKRRRRRRRRSSFGRSFELATSELLLLLRFVHFIHPPAAAAA